MLLRSTDLVNWPKHPLIIKLIDCCSVFIYKGDAIYICYDKISLAASQYVEYWFHF